MFFSRDDRLSAIGRVLILRMTALGLLLLDIVGKVAKSLCPSQIRAVLVEQSIRWRGAYRFSSAALLGRELVVAVVPCGHAVRSVCTETDESQLAESYSSLSRQIGRRRRISRCFELRPSPHHCTIES